jgi:hypothetical protein
MTNVQLPMQSGSSGDGVQELQYRLLFVGGQFAATGRFDDDTDRAVRHYEQYTVGRDATGVVDEALWERLVADSNHAGYTGPQTFEVGAVHPTTAVERSTIQELNNLSTRLVAMGGRHVSAIDSACDNFVAGYGKPRVAQMNAGVLGTGLTGGGYGKYLGRHLVSEAGKAITDWMEEKLKLAVPEGALLIFAVKSVWIGLSMGVERRVGIAVEQAVMSDEHRIEHQLDVLVAKMRDQLNQGLVEMQNDANARFQDVVDRINAGEQLDEGTTVLCQQLYGAGPEVVDGIIEQWFGIPTNPEALRVEVYEALVRAFEAFIIEVTENQPNAGSYSSETYHEAQVREFDQHRRAYEAAEEAAKHLPPR